MLIGVLLLGWEEKQGSTWRGVCVGFFLIGDIIVHLYIDGYDLEERETLMMHEKEETMAHMYIR